MKRLWVLVALALVVTLLVPRPASAAGNKVQITVTVTKVKMTVSFDDCCDANAELYVEGNVKYEPYAPAAFNENLMDDYNFDEERTVTVVLYSQPHCPGMETTVNATVRERDVMMHDTVGTGAATFTQPGTMDLIAGGATLTINVSASPTNDECPSPPQAPEKNVSGGGGFAGTGSVSPGVSQGLSTTLDDDAAGVTRSYTITGTAPITAASGTGTFTGLASISASGTSKNESILEGAGRLDLVVSGAGFFASMNGHWHRVGDNWEALVRGPAGIGSNSDTWATAYLVGKAVPNSSGVGSPMTSFAYAGTIEFLPFDFSVP